MRFDRFDLTVWGVIAGLCLSFAGVVLAGDRAGAQVLRAFPEPGAQIGAYGPWGIEFRQPMRATSLAEHFSIDPPVAGQWQWSGNTARYVPGQPLKPGVEYTAQLRPGALSENGRQVKEAVEWRFTARPPSLLYIAPSTGGPPELWRSPLEPDAGLPRQLTNTGGKVFDYAAARDGESIVYTVINPEGGVDLWIMDHNGGGARLLVECGFDRCTVPSWSPDGTRLAYSREEQGLAPGAPHGPPRVWTVAVTSGETTPLYQNSQVLGYGPSWSPDGRRLAFFDGGVGGIRILDVLTAGEVVLPSWMGVVGAFSPDGEQMYFTDVRIVQEQVTSVLYLANLSTQDIGVPFSDSAPWSDYGAPAWSPDGQWIAVSLRVADTGPAKQLWIMRPDGTDARPVSKNPAYTHGAYRWDAWGRALIFQVVPLGTPYPEPELLHWSFESDTIRVLAKNATLPGWLP
jgi:TolB protein